MKNCEEKVLVEYNKYQALKENLLQAEKDMSKLEEIILKKNGYFKVRNRGSQYDSKQDPYCRFFQGFTTVEFYGDLKNEPIAKAVKSMEERIEDYENKLLELFRVIVKRDNVDSIQLSEHFEQAHREQLKELNEEMRAKIIEEEIDNLKTEKSKRADKKLDKIPFWIRVIFKAI